MAIKRRDFLKVSTALAAGSALAGGTIWPAAAQNKKGTLLVAEEGGPNSLDEAMPGANRYVHDVSWNCYDRLATFGLKKDENGNDYYDYKNIQPELAESWELTEKSITFKLRKDATFHDGTPVTAKDVKWSLDRVIGVGGYPKFIFGAVSMTKPEQFVVVDDHTFRVDFIKYDPYTLPYLAAPTAAIYNSTLVQKHVTAADPWGIDWAKKNLAAGGAYTVASWTPGQEIVYQRNEKWKSGPLPKIQRIIARVVPDAGTRRALLERGDIDFSFDVPARDASDLAAANKLKVISALMESTSHYLSIDTKIAPFDKIKVRQAIAYAVPYDQIVKLAYYGRGRSLGGGADKITTPVWPQPGPYKTDIAKAKQLLSEAGLPDGFETTLSYDISAAITNEPLCLLLQQNLAQIGIKVTLNKIPGANWRSSMASHKLPLLTNIFGGWLAYPYFYFGWLYPTGDSLYNTANYSNPAMDKLIDQSHYDTDPKAAAVAGTESIQLAYDDVPFVPILQPTLNVAMQPNVSGYSYWFFRQPDYRKFVKA